MPFDAKAWIAAHEPPTYIDRQGATHIGHLWSHLEYLQWVKVFQGWLESELPDDAYEAGLRRLISSMRFSEAVVDEMLALPSVALEEVLGGFFVCQRAGARALPSTPAPPAPSESSPTIRPVSVPSAS